MDSYYYSPFPLREFPLPFLFNLLILNSFLIQMRFFSLYSLPIFQAFLSAMLSLVLGFLLCLSIHSFEKIFQKMVLPDCFFYSLSISIFFIHRFYYIVSLLEGAFGNFISSRVYESRISCCDSFFHFERNSSSLQ